MRGIDFTNPELFQEEIAQDIIKNEPVSSNNTNNENKPNKFIPLEFRGNVKEFFKIWIVNIALTLLTLGIYSAWAKVRNNRYIYANTYLKGSNFEYNADPKRILLGRAIVVLFYGLFYLAGHVLGMQELALAIGALFLLLLPWLMRQAVAFKLKVTTYRNLQFHYLAQARAFYFLFIKYIAIVALTLIPTIFLVKHYPQYIFVFFFLYLFYMFVLAPAAYKDYLSLIINNSAYANAKFYFEAQKRKVLQIFLKLILWSIVLGFLIFMAKFFVMLLLHFVSSITTNKYVMMGTIYVIVAFVYLIQIGFFKGLSDAYFSNFARNHTKLENLQLKGKMEPFKLGFISATNAVAIFFSLGLLYPWAKMRYLNYKLSHTFIEDSDFDEFSSHYQEVPNTLGEETLDFFDIDIGL